MLKKLEKIELGIVKVCFFLFLIFFAVGNVFFTVRQFHAVDSTANYLRVDMIHVLTVAILVGLYLLAERAKISSKKLLLIFLIFAAAVSAYWIFSNPQKIKELDDAYNVMRSARAVANGDYGPIGYHTYMNDYPNNFGLFTVFFVLVKIFGDNSELAFRIINLGFMLEGYVALYLLTEELFHEERVQKALVFLFFFSMQYVFYTFFVYGNVISYALGMSAAYAFLRYRHNGKLPYLCAAVVLVILSIFVKNNSAIILAAMIIYLFLEVVHQKKWASLLAILVLLGGFRVSTEGIIDFWEARSGTTYDNRLPKICWIVYGFNYDERHPGGYTNELEVYHYENDFVAEFTAVHAREMLDMEFTAFRERPHVFFRFLGQKFLVSWANPEFEAFGQYAELDLPPFNDDLVNGKGNDVINAVWDGASSLVALAALYLFFRERKEMDLSVLFPAVIILGGFFFHAFWETKAIYLYQYYLFLLPYAAKGLSSLRKEQA